jgi:pimeloyl-ACP methyl ester carboxylesterase
MKTLVFVHGYFGGGEQWAAQVQAFGGQFQVITPDLPGFGAASHLNTPETIRGLAINVLSQLDSLGVHRFHLVGHSMGGMIVQEMVMLVPERIEKLVLYGTGPMGQMPGRFETIDESRKGLWEQGVEASGRRIAATWFKQGESGRGYELCAKIADQASMQAALAGLAAMETWSGEKALANIKAPALVLWGDGDRAYLWPQPEKLWREIASAQLAVIPGCAHAVHLEKPYLFNAVLQDFLEDD